MKHLPFLVEAVLAMANKHAPRYQVADIAPNTYEELVSKTEQDGFITVWSGASDNTIFGNERVNHAFRAWHDSAHLRGGYDFSLRGEILAAKRQCLDLVQSYLPCAARGEAIIAILIEVIGQAAHYAKTGEFVSDQIAFFDTEGHKASYRRIARKIAA